MKIPRLSALLLWPLLIPISIYGQKTVSQPLPKVLLLGDVVSAKQMLLVQQRLAGKAIVSAPEGSLNSGSILENLDAWLAEEKPSVIHFSSGSEDLQAVVQRLKKVPDIALVYALPTGTSAEEKTGIKTTLTLMHGADIPVHDLRSLTKTTDENLAESVADTVLRQWTILNYSKPTPPRPSGPEAAAKYRADEAAHDAEVPAAYKKLPIGQFKLPKTPQAWQEQRPGVLKTVIESLGDLPARPAEPAARLISRELRRGYALERVSIDNGEGNDISALVLIPDQRQAKAPAILWLHSSTPDKNGLITAGSDPESLGESFVKAGYVVIAPDAWYYGDRAENVPSGPRDVYRRGVPPYATVTQDSLLKLNLWLGRTLWGMMVRDDQIALDYLSQRPEVDPQRIGATGMSMGSTRAWWLAAVDERVAATVGVACLTRYENLILHGNLKGHGLYYFSYGLLKHFDTEGVISLIAPRPFLALTGDLDYGSPVDGIMVINEKVSQVYQTLNAPEAFRSLIYPDVGHTYTPEMRTQMLSWFHQWLKPALE